MKDNQMAFSVMSEVGVRLQQHVVLLAASVDTLHSSQAGG